MQTFSFKNQLIWIYTVCKGLAYPGSAGLAGLSGSAARQKGDEEAGIRYPPGLQHCFIEIGHKMFSIVILSRWFKASFWRKNVHNTGEALKRTKPAQ